MNINLKKEKLFLLLRRGFSLLEILISICIILILLSLAIIAYYLIFGDTKEAVAKAEMAEIAKYANIFYIKHGGWPDSFEQLAKDRFVKSNLVSPYGTKYFMDDENIYCKTPDGRLLSVSYRTSLKIMDKKKYRQAINHMNRLTIKAVQFYFKNGYWPEEIKELSEEDEEETTPWGTKYKINNGRIECIDDKGKKITKNFTDIDSFEYKKQKAYMDMQNINELIKKFYEKFGRWPKSVDELKQLGKVIIPYSPFKSKYSLKNGYITVKTDKGTVLKMNYKAEKTFLSTMVSGVNNIKSLQIRDLVIDSSQNVWAATWGGGIARFNGKAWKTYTKEDGLASNYVYSLAIDSKGKLYIGTFSGLSLFDKRSFITFTRRDGLPVDRILSLCIDSRDNLFIGTWKDGVYKFKGRVLAHYKETHGIKGMVYSIAIDSQDGIWIGSWFGGVTYIKDGKYKNFDINSGLPVNHVPSIAIVGNKVWVATWGGGVCCLENNSWKIYNTKNGLPNNYIYKIFVDPSFNIWTGAEGGGICKFDGKSWEVYYNQEEIMKRYGITAITSDYMGQIFIGTWGKGILKYGYDF